MPRARIDPTKPKRCPRCAIVKEPRDFGLWIDSRRPDRTYIDAYCKDCRRAYDRDYERRKVRDNPGYLEAERTRKREYSRRPEVKARTSERQRARRPARACAYCGRPVEHNGRTVCLACADMFGGYGRVAHIRSTYGLSPKDYGRLYITQKGRCAVCLRVLVHGRDRVCVDHDHATGAIRGLLCHRCNSAAGHLRDDWQLASALSRYLRNWHKNALNELPHASPGNFAGSV